MIQAIYWILGILVMLVLLITSVYTLIYNIKTNKERNKIYIEYLDEQIELLETMKNKLKEEK